MADTREAALRAPATTEAIPTEAAPAETVPARSSLDPSIRRIWDAVRAPLIVAVVILLTALGIGYVHSRANHGLLDPRSADPAGARAIAELLRQEGVTVDLVRTTQQAVGRSGGDSTLLVVFPELLQRAQLDALDRSQASRVVLVGPTDDALAEIAPGISIAGDAPVEPREPACPLPATQRAGDADIGGMTFAARSGVGERAVLCYAANGEPALVSLRTATRDVVVLGSPTPLTNDKLDERGNAALTMNLLGAHGRLVWYLPSLGDSVATERKSLYELIPAGWKWGAAQVGVAVLLLALWRMRRLGPVVAEPLPVVVRAAEAVEGRARLYRRGRARDHAAEVLRSATRARLAPLVGLSATADADALIDAVAAHTGQTPGLVGGALYGAAPADDATLVRLADELDALEGEVRRS